MEALLEVKNLKTQFHTEAGLVKAVDDVSYRLYENEIVGLVGESGCGKSVSQFSVMQLISTPPGKIVGGNIIFEGHDLLKFEANGPEMRSIRGAKIAMIYQEPMTALNPVLTLCRQLTEALELHLRMDAKASRKRAVEMLELVGIPSANKRVDDYPYQFSGGMRQRVVIAMALCCNPRLIIADEPTTSLDVTTQAQLLELIKDMVKNFKATLVIVTHNLGVVARYAQRIYVMYAGRIIEAGTTKEIFRQPLHPYTVGLLKCIPRLNQNKKEKLVPIIGMPPRLVNRPLTCAFLPRCSCSLERCKQDTWPPLTEIDNEHYVSCYACTREEPSGLNTK
ncbi:MAG: ABC transporter ATP-binding protein [Dehalococcoidales bacterium]|nr:ABC transporter ATP-binding protein [Dehalococcoidales bacterium]